MHSAPVQVTIVFTPGGTHLQGVSEGIRWQRRGHSISHRGTLRLSNGRGAPVQSKARPAEEVDAKDTAGSGSDYQAGRYRQHICPGEVRNLFRGFVKDS
jgi:hypothetical protein